MTRRTSIAAYHRIVNDGLLPKSRMRIYRWLFHNGPATVREVFAGLDEARGEFTRFTELRRQGVLEEVGEQVCTVTQQTAILWDVTTLARPRKLPKRSKRALSKHSIAALRALWLEATTPADRWAIERVVQLANERALRADLKAIS